MSQLKLTKSTIIAIIIAIIIISSFATYRFGVSSLGSEHIHAQYGVIIKDMKLDFDTEKYPEYLNGDDQIFLEEYYDYLIHRYAPNADLGRFFGGMEIEFNSECLVLDKPISDLTETEFCNNGNKTLKMFVNNSTNNQFDKYIPMDKDMILIIYGNQNSTEIQDMVNEFSKFKHFIVLDE